MTLALFLSHCSFYFGQYTKQISAKHECNFNYDDDESANNDESVENDDNEGEDSMKVENTTVYDTHIRLKLSIL